MKKISVLTLISILLMQIVSFADEVVPEVTTKRSLSSSDTFKLIETLVVIVIALSLVVLVVTMINYINNASNERPIEEFNKNNDNEEEK